MFVRQFKFFTTPLIFLTDHEDTMSVDAGITNRFYKVGEFTNMEFVNNES